MQSSRLNEFFKFTTSFNIENKYVFTMIMSNKFLLLKVVDAKILKHHKEIMS